MLLCYMFLLSAGIFAPISKISKPGAAMKSASPSKQVPAVNQGTVDVSHITSKVDTGKDSGRPVHIFFHLIQAALFNQPMIYVKHILGYCVFLFGFIHIILVLSI